MLVHHLYQELVGVVEETLVTTGLQGQRVVLFSHDARHEFMRDERTISGDGAMLDPLVHLKGKLQLHMVHTLATRNFGSREILH